MSRPKPSLFAFSIFSSTLLFLVGLASPDSALAGPPTLSVSPTSLSFTTPAGVQSSSQMVTATPNGGQISFPPGHGGIAITAPFVITKNTCVEMEENHREKRKKELRLVRRKKKCNQKNLRIPCQFRVNHYYFS